MVSGDPWPYDSLCPDMQDVSSSEEIYAGPGMKRLANGYSYYVNSPEIYLKMEEETFNLIFGHLRIACSRGTIIASETTDIVYKLSMYWIG